LANNRISFLVILAVLFSIYCFVLGESGIVQRMRLEDEKLLIAGRIARLEATQKKLQGLYETYKSGKSSRDDAIKAGFIGAGERIIILRNMPQENTATDRRPTPAQRFSVELRHLRILWVLVSLTVVALYFLKTKERNPNG
jgi:hypothetical protein